MTLRLDQALVAAGLAPTRSRAQALIAAGAVTLDGNSVAKPGLRVPPDARLGIDGRPACPTSRAPR